MSDFLKVTRDLSGRVWKHTGLLLGGTVIAGLSFILGILGVDLAVPTVIAVVIMLAVVAMAVVRAHGEVLNEKDAAITERDEALLASRSTQPRVSDECIHGLGTLLNQANILFAERLSSEDALANWMDRVTEWVKAVEALLVRCAGRADADLFHDIAGRQRMRFDHKFSANHNHALNNLKNWKDNLAELLKGYRQVG